MGNFVILDGCSMPGSLEPKMARHRTSVDQFRCPCFAYVPLRNRSTKSYSSSVGPFTSKAMCNIVHSLILFHYPIIWPKIGSIRVDSPDSEMRGGWSPIRGTRPSISLRRQAACVASDRGVQWRKGSRRTPTVRVGVSERRTEAAQLYTFLIGVRWRGGRGVF